MPDCFEVFYHALASIISHILAQPRLSTLVLCQLAPKGCVGNCETLSPFAATSNAQSYV